nr:immunoglobulin light chain junction region [Macaca mulatta]
CQQYSGLPFTF